MRTGGKPGAGSNADTKNTSRRAPPGGVNTIGMRRQLLSSKASQQPCLCGHKFKKTKHPVTSTYLVEHLLIFSVTIDNNGQHNVYSEE